VYRFEILDTPYYILEGEKNLNSLFLHLYFKEDKKFTKSVYKQMLEDWVEVLDSVKEAGLKEVMTLVPKTDKICKWQTMFGLVPFLEFKDEWLYRREL